MLGLTHRYEHHFSGETQLFVDHLIKLDPFNLTFDDYLSFFTNDSYRWEIISLHVVAAASPEPALSRWHQVALHPTQPFFVHTSWPLVPH